MKRSQKITLATLRAMKEEGRRIVMLTAYDATLAGVLDRGDVDCILVGDSLGNIVQGHGTTVPVTLEQMAYHVECVRRGVERALLIADLPFLTYADEQRALAAAGRLMQAGAEMVKLEGGAPVAGIAARLVELGVPVCGHLGLTPQSVHQLSGHRVQGRAPRERARLLDDARALEQAGCGLLVLECIPSGLAAEVARAVATPVIGIGAGPEVDGQVLVLHDALGLNPRPARFVRDFLAEAGSIPEAVSRFVTAVREGDFPAVEESWQD
ncbi:MAG: 3-methyl-2-oxobutanoate hydroxymethyltransferase [Wenzhouxiangellaceae bacterium]